MKTIQFFLPLIVLIAGIVVMWISFKETPTFHKPMNISADSVIHLKDGFDEIQSKVKCPPGWKLLDDSGFIRDDKGDTLFIKHVITHEFRFQVLTKREKKLARQYLEAE